MNFNARAQSRSTSLRILVSRPPSRHARSLGQRQQGVLHAQAVRHGTEGSKEKVQDMSRRIKCGTKALERVAFACTTRLATLTHQIERAEAFLAATSAPPQTSTATEGTATQAQATVAPPGKAARRPQRSAQAAASKAATVSVAPQASSAAKDSSASNGVGGADAVSVAEPESTSGDEPASSTNMANVQTNGKVLNPAAASPLEIVAQQSLATSVQKRDVGQKPPHECRVSVLQEPVDIGAVTGRPGYEGDRLHPGVRGSSSITMATSDDGRTAVVTVRAAVQVSTCDSKAEECLRDGGDGAPDGLAMAFAAASAANSAAECSRDVLERTWLPPTTAPAPRTHAAITTALSEHNIHRVLTHTTSQFSHEMFVVELRDKETGARRKAVFKPRVKGDSDGWHRAPIERVAYVLSRMLGMDWVPPTVYRGALGFDGRSFAHGGAMMHFVDGVQELSHVKEADWGTRKAALLSDTRILDVLLHNSDRHKGHFLFGPHWVHDASSPILIDHAAGFRSSASVTMEDENAFCTGAVEHVCPSTYLRLKLLSTDVVFKELGDLLSPAELLGMLQRRNGILTYLDRLVEERGVENVVLHE